MEYYDTSLQDAIDQYTNSHELIEPQSTPTAVHPYAPQLGRIVHPQMTNIQHHPHLPRIHPPQTAPGVLMHTSSCTLPKKVEEHQSAKDGLANTAKDAKKSTKKRKRPQIPNENKNVKKRKIKKKPKNKGPYADNPQRYRNKIQREMGLEYQGHVKVNDKWEKVGKESKKLKARCNCKYSKSKAVAKIKCGTITDDERQEIFNSFWKLSWKEKRLYVRLMVNIKPVANKTLKKDSRRLKTLEIHLKCEDRYVRVCKKMFLQTLSLSEWSLKDWIHGGDGKEPDKSKDSKDLKADTEMESTEPTEEPEED